ncbi:hypothetical protein EVAR_62863_1 [Eumeta japonica]|uniref:Uncharacterized protein n=1 Tax=Eumeta variegata TaxID=151549 RepID=A0A4C2A215_EUMVA|nr:hypothetical protein EVAR_62863_1 [Eumeta japonica]
MFGAGNCSYCVYSVSAAALVHVRQLGGSCPVLGFTCEEDSINAVIHPLEIVRDPSPSPSASGKRAASVLSDDGSSGSDSTIRALRLRTRTTLKWSGPRSASEKG